MKLSIIITVYNAKKHLCACIDSFLNQTCSDYEIVLIDDGSSDGSDELCKSYCQNYKNIIVVHQKNMGPFHARRNGIYHATGEYIWCVDSDDKAANNYVVEELMNILNKNPDLLLFNASFSSKPNEKMFDYNLPTNVLFRNKEEIYKGILCSNSYNMLWNKIFKRNLLDFDADYSKLGRAIVGEDLLQFFPILDKVETIYFYDKIIYWYRINENSVTHCFDPSIFHAIKYTGNVKHYYLKKLDYIDKDKLFFSSLSSCATAAYKVRFCSKEERKHIAVKYLNSIATDVFFLNAYKKSSVMALPLSKRILVVLLKYKMYRTIIICSIIMKWVRKK